MIQPSSKKKSLVSYANMSAELQAAFKEKYPRGYADYMEDWDYGYGPPMNMMPPFRYARGGRGQNQYNQYPYQGNQYEQGMGS